MTLDGRLHGLGVVCYRDSGVLVASPQRGLEFGIADSSFVSMVRPVRGLSPEFAKTLKARIELQQTEDRNSTEPT